MTQQDEGSLIGEAQRGSAAAFEELIRRYDAGVLRMALRMVRSEDEARDIYQQVFLKAYRSIREFRGDCSFRTWVFRIVTNLCLDHARRKAVNREEPFQPMGGGYPDDWTVEAARLLVDRRPDGDPERALQARDIRRRIAEALRRLPERERLVFEMKHDQEMRLSTVAEVLNTSEETVRNCLYRAHQRLRAELSDLRGGGPAGAPERAAPAAQRAVRGRGSPEPLNGVE